MKKKEVKKKLFLPMITAVIVTILVYLFSLLFLDNFNTTINYIFLGLIYVYSYISLYCLFNDMYIGAIEKNFKLLNKVHLLKFDKIKKNNKFKNKLVLVYLLLKLSFISFILFVWQMILKVDFASVTSIISIVLIILSLVCSILLSRFVVSDKKKSKKEKE